MILQLQTRLTRRRVNSGDLTNLLHDTGLALREGDVATRLVSDELDLDLAALATWLVIVVVLVIGGRWALTLDSTVLVGCSVSVAYGVRIVKYRWAGLLVLVGDVGHVDNWFEV